MGSNARDVRGVNVPETRYSGPVLTAVREPRAVVLPDE